MFIIALLHLLHCCYFVYNLPLCKYFADDEKKYEYFGNMLYHSGFTGINELIYLYIIILAYLVITKYHNKGFAIKFLVIAIIFPLIYYIILLFFAMYFATLLWIVVNIIQTLIKIVYNKYNSSCDSIIYYLYYLPFIEAIRYLFFRKIRIRTSLNKHHKIINILICIIIYIVLVAIYTMPLEILIHFNKQRWLCLYSSRCIEKSFKRDKLAFWGFMLAITIYLFNAFVYLIENKIFNRKNNI